MSTSTPVSYARWDGVGRGFTVVDVAVGPPGPGDLLVRVDLATVCGSDLHTVHGRRPAPAPSVLGHEQVGTVVATGADPPTCTDGAVAAVGSRVVWSVAASCGTCARCRVGLEPKCHALYKYGHEPLAEHEPLGGGFATHCLVRRGTAVTRVPDVVPDLVASPASCATATVAAALAAGPPDLTGRRVLVTGAGMLGLTAAAMAARAGAHVVVADPHPERRRHAADFGAAQAVEDGSATDPVDLAVEVSGAGDAVRVCLDSLAVGATAVLVGSVSPGPPVALDPERLVRGWQTVTGVHNYRPRDLQTAVDFLAAAHADHPFADLVTGRHALDDLDAATGTTGAPRRAVAPHDGPALRSGRPPARAGCC